MRVGLRPNLPEPVQQAILEPVLLRPSETKRQLERRYLRPIDPKRLLHRRLVRARFVAALERGGLQERRRVAAKVRHGGVLESAKESWDEACCNPMLETAVGSAA